MAGALTPRATQRSRSASSVSGWICDAVMRPVSPRNAHGTIRVPDKASRATSHHSGAGTVSAICAHGRLRPLRARAARRARRREVSAVDALEAVLDRADRIADPLNPFALRLDDRARRAAAAADAALARGDGGPLCGIP